MKTDYVRRDGSCMLYAQVHIKGKTVKLPVEISLEPMFWDKDKEVVKNYHPKAEELNMMLDQVRTNVFEIRKRYMLQNLDLTIEALRAEFRTSGGSDDFLVFMRREIEIHQGELSVNTSRQYKSVLAKLIGFKSQIMYSDLTPDLLNQFQVHCRKLGNNLNTTHKNLKVMKVFVNYAMKRDLLKKNPFDNVRIRKGKPTLVYLAKEERDLMMQMFDGRYTSEKYRRVLHYFLFACFTGLRISDIKLLRWENIADHTIYITPFKTRRVNQETVIIPLGAKAMWLLERVEKRPRCPYVFDIISEQKTNQYLKEIADMVGIKKNLHFHVARHTFATLFLEATNDLATLQKLLGHSNIQQTMVYAHVSDQLRRSQMKLFDGLS